MSGWTAFTGTMKKGSSGPVFNQSVYHCGETFAGATTVCPAGVTEFPDGDMYVIAMSLAAPLMDGDNTTLDPNLEHIYAAVFDSDDVADNNYTDVGVYDWDYWQGTDRWYQVKYDGAWTAVVQDWAGSNAQTASSAARAVVRGDSIVWFIPASELPSPSGYRLSAFAHDGSFQATQSGGDVNAADPTEPLTPIPTTSVVFGE
jgi:hypothetical protein